MTVTNPPAQPSEPPLGSGFRRDDLRAQMPITQRFAYFDHAAVAPLPRVSAEAIARYADEACQLGDTPWMAWNRCTEVLREQLATLISAQVDEIALIPNTSTGIGLVAEGLRWQPGDSLVVPANEFPSNLAPWRNLARRGVEIREVPVAADAQGVAPVALDKLLEAMDQSTRLVAVSWVGFLSGWRIDVAEFCQAIHQRGAMMFLDAIQGIGAFPLDVSACGVDFCAADGHKWMLGPEGAGLLYVRRDRLERLDPLMIGWHSLDPRAAFDPHNTALRASAARYEGGSANMAGLIGLESSIRVLLQSQANRAGSGFAEAILSNVAELVERLEALGCWTSVPASETNRSGIVTIGWPDANGDRDPLVVRKRCLDEGIVTSVRGGRLRVSTHAYNNSDDINRFTECLKACL